MHELKLEGAHNKFQKYVKSEMLKLCREYDNQKISEEELNAVISVRLSQIMMESFKEYLLHSGYEGDLGSVLTFDHKKQIFKLNFPENILDDMEKKLEGSRYDKGSVGKFFSFVKKYPIELTNHFRNDAKDLANLILDTKSSKHEAIQNKIDSMRDKYNKHSSDLLHISLSILVIGAIVTGFVFLNATGVLPITVVAGACSSSMFFLLARPQMIADGLTSIPGIISISKQMNEYKFEKDDLKKLPELNDEDLGKLEKVFEERSSLRKSGNLTQLDSDALLLSEMLEGLGKKQGRDLGRDPMPGK